MVVIQQLTASPSKTAAPLLMRIEKIERKCFPAHEAFDFNSSILKKSNLCILSVSPDDQLSTILAYSVSVRFRKTLLLHKICVVEHMRHRGIGKAILDNILERAEQSACSQVELWVDPSRVAARALYLKAGFHEVQTVQNYYAPGRNGVKMSVDLPRV